ncbi:MAG: response regulator transcription factor [Chloroflexi bacterium]|nr:response regulator transcription factor [Chloroflexota bacterium]
MAKVLVVDDEVNLLHSVAYSLRKEGYEVATAADGPSALTTAARERPDVVILDVMLPQMDGFEVCRRLRQTSTVPILMLSAKTDEIDRVVGLEVGADDYLTKPFSMRELLARVRAMLRRAQMIQRASAAAEEPAVLRVGDLELDPARHQARRDGRPLALKPKEFELLAFLMRHPGRVFPAGELVEQVWGYDFEGDARTVAVHVHGLREKIEDDPSNPRRIETVRGVGYRLTS